MEENVVQKINIYKEILSTMPINNEKNIERYNSKIYEIKQEYEEYKEEILKEILIRYNNYIKCNPTNNIRNLENEIENYELILNIMNDIQSSYEKTNLDKEVYKLAKFYKENLERVNNQIMTCINIFRNIGISISNQDFMESKYASEYMKVFFNEMKSGDINSQFIKESFEQIYWKCPDLIIHIEIIINNIYLKNKKRIDKYYLDKKVEVLKKYKINLQNTLINYKSDQKQLEKEKSIEKKQILDNFLTGVWNVKDYEEEKIKQIYKKYITIEEMTTEKMAETNENIEKFTRSIFEYKKYLEFKYIFDDIREKYKEIDKYRNSYKNSLKEIEKCEKQLKNVNKPHLFRKKVIDDTKVNNIFLKEKQIYKKLFENILYKKISDNINENSTILDILYFASSFYRFLVDTIINDKQGIASEEIDKIILELREFIKYPYFTIINNIKMNEDKDIALIIKDRYKLLDFNIEKEDLQEENLDNLLNELQKINISNNIKKSGLNIEDIKNLCEYKNILEKEKLINN